MILIFSTSGDSATTAVMQWLSEITDELVLRINSDDPADASQWEVAVENGRLALRHGRHGDQFGVKDINAIWYRKGTYSFCRRPVIPEVPNFPDSSGLDSQLRREEAVIIEYIHFVLSSVPRILGAPWIARLNKLMVLSAARECGLAIPLTIISNRRQTFVEHMEHTPLVAKAASTGLWSWEFGESRRAYFSYTELLTKELLGSEATLPLSLGQQAISKVFEVRSFYLDGEFFSTAIMPCRGHEHVDIRKDGSGSSTRLFPYTLPRTVANALDMLYRRLGLNTGSSDIIVDDEGTHIFLEINPVGIYSGPGFACNYDLNRKIAQWLSGSDGQHAKG